MSGEATTPTADELTRLGATVRLRREREGLTLAALGERAGVSHTTVYRVEYGATVGASLRRCRLRAVTVARVLVALDFTDDETAAVVGGSEWGQHVRDYARALRSATGTVT